MAKDTKTRILEASLEMFSENGYAGTNIRELAASLGLGKSSLYRHFESKEDLWNAILNEMSSYYNEIFGSEENLPAVPSSTGELEELTLRMFRLTVRDRKIVMTRKILMTEQFRDERIRDLATQHFGVTLEAMFSKLFAAMMENGILEKNDPAMLAFAYTAPVTSLVHLCDRDPGKEAEAEEKLRLFTEHFIRTYEKHRV